MPARKKSTFLGPFVIIGNICKRNCRRQRHTTRNRNKPICVTLPKVAKASTMVTVACCWHRHYRGRCRSKLCQCKHGLTKKTVSWIRPLFILQTLRNSNRPIALYSVHANPANDFYICTSGKDSYVRIFDRRNMSNEDSTPVKKFCPEHLVSIAPRRCGGSLWSLYPNSLQSSHWLRGLCSMQWVETNPSNIRIFRMDIRLLPPDGTMLTAFTTAFTDVARC